MARAPLTFKMTDVVRLVKAAHKAGLDVTRINLDGSVETVPHDNDNVPLETSALEAWKAKHATKN